MAIVAAHKAEPALAAMLLEQQSLYSKGQREMAIASPHLLYVIARRRTLPQALRLAVYARDLGICRYCDVSLRPSAFTVDHVIPVARGGEDSEGNLVVACRSCNSSKGAR